MRDWEKDTSPPSLADRIEFALLCVAMAIAIVTLGWSWLGTSAANAHPGGLAADGCHNDRKNGGRHCHRGPSAGTPTVSLKGDVYYPNCAAARAAGAAPIYRGQRGYGTHLDRDGDGKACE